MKRIIKCFLIALLIVIILIAAIAIRNMLILKKLLSLSNNVNKNNYRLTTTMENKEGKTIFDAYYKDGMSYEERKTIEKTGDKKEKSESYYYKKHGKVVAFYSDGTTDTFTVGDPGSAATIYTIENVNMIKNIYYSDLAPLYRIRLYLIPIVKDTFEGKEVYVFNVGMAKLYVDAKTGLSLYYIFDKNDVDSTMKMEYDFADIDDSIFDYENSDNLKKN